jgi:hypothetical protein
LRDWESDADMNGSGRLRRNPPPPVEAPSVAVPESIIPSADANTE